LPLRRQQHGSSGRHFDELSSIEMHHVTPLTLPARDVDRSGIWLIPLLILPYASGSRGEIVSGLRPRWATRSCTIARPQPGSDRSP
jgi:hypothetical protein